MSATGPLALSVVFTYSAVNPEDFDIDAGRIGLCQLVKEVSSYTPSGGESMSVPQLDEGYPYHSTYVGVDASPNASPTQHQDDDGPNRDLTDKTSFTLNILYITTEMYSPEGGVDVPLHTSNWSWITSGSQNNSSLLWSPPSGGLTTGSGGADFDLPSATWSAVKHLH